MLRCKTSYAEIASIEDVRLVGNSLVCWPSSLKNCKRVKHPMRESKSFLRDKITCRSAEQESHIGNVQNNLTIGDYKDKHVALFRATDVVLDCGQGVIIDFPSWKALREMLVSNRPEIKLSVNSLLKLATGAEEEVAAGLAEEVVVGGGEAQQEEETYDTEVKDAADTEATDGLWPAEDDEGAGATKRPIDDVLSKVVREAPQKRTRARRNNYVDPDAWLQKPLSEYPTAIQLVSDPTSRSYKKLLEEAEDATVVAFDAQWAPDFGEGTDNQIALLQIAFPHSGNTYVLQLPLLGMKMPDEVKRLFESSEVTVCGFAANEIDIHKFEISGVNIDTDSLHDLQPWCEAEMGENDSVKLGWRVGLKRSVSSVIGFEMDKTTTVAASNWEREELTPAQVEYAAMDVWVALRLYQELAPVYRP